MSKTTPKRGRGRPKGSRNKTKQKTIVSVSMEELASIVGSSGNVMVSRKWLQSLGVELEGDTSTKVKVAEEEKIELKSKVL